MKPALPLALCALAFMAGRMSNPRAIIEDVVCDNAPAITACLVYQRGQAAPVYNLEIAHNARPHT